MTTTAIGNLASTDGTAVLSTRQAKYGENPFLRLLTEQLKNQTPLEPVDNESFMNQMASYTTMQEQRDLNTNMLKLLDYQGLLARVQGLSQGSALLGKQVAYLGEGGQEAKGQVTSVFVDESGDVKLKLADGKQIDLRTVTGIEEAATGSSSGSSNTGSSSSGSTSSTGSSSSSSSSSSGSGS